MKLQNTFVQSRMNRDIDERLIPKGQYINAENIRVVSSDGSDVGAVENIKVNVPYDYKEYCILNFKTYPPENIPIEKRRPHEGDGHCDPYKPCQHTIDQYSSLYN